MGTELLPFLYMKIERDANKKEFSESLSMVVPAAAALLRGQTALVLRRRQNGARML